MTLAKSEAKLLHERISDKEYNHEDIIRILATRSKAQINATLNHYKNEFGNDINKVSSDFLSCSLHDFVISLTKSLWYTKEGYTSPLELHVVEQNHEWLAKSDHIYYIPVD